MSNSETGHAISTTLINYDGISQYCKPSKCDNCSINELCKHVDKVKEFTMAVDKAANELAQISGVEISYTVNCKHYRRVK